MYNTFNLNKIYTYDEYARLVLVGLAELKRVKNNIYSKT